MILSEKVYPSNDYGLYALNDYVLKYHKETMLVEDPLYGLVLSSVELPPEKKTLWFGPYVPMPPGNYTFQVNLRIDTPVPSDLFVMYVDVVYDASSQQVARFPLYGANFTDTNWHTFVFHFYLKDLVFVIEFRGRVFTTLTTVYFASFEIIRGDNLENSVLPPP